ncbi:putative GMP synthase [glutamine-hydrolyzing] [Symbiodinium microadriaticum]|uniref:Putative GMP synthase [glutamine-hydrolyzing] n=1 Tax=Symbiodinium microadriaticum TaxID=2951 RepID=A0A1Q9D6H8_SYMMI|nr:putative GMP synthase [glutamine-hydrolyzing] [Symbiodinium microadriaticum]
MHPSKALDVLARCRLRRSTMAKKRPAASPASSPASKRRRSGNEEPAWYESYAGGTADYYRRYMDKEWGVPIYGPGRSRDNKLFELLTLEGAQAGLSWDTILKKREAYRRSFDGFDIATVAAYTPAKVKALLNSPGEGSEVIVKNRAKIESTVRNAKLCQEAAAEYGSFGKFMWAYVAKPEHLQLRAAMTGSPLRCSSTSQRPVRSKSGTPRIPLKLKGKRPLGPLAPPHGSGRLLIEENFPWHQEHAEVYYAKSMARARLAFDRVLGDATAQPQDNFSDTDVRDRSIGEVTPSILTLEASC